MTSILPKPSSRTRKPIEELQSTSNSNQTHQITSDQKTTTTTHTPSMMIKEDEIQTYNLTHQLLPHSNIHKLMKQSLPIEIKISNSSKSLIQSCVSEFLIFILSHSNSLLSSSTTTTTSSSSIKRKTINGLDLLESLKHLGFWGYFNVLKIYLIKYRSIVNQNNHKRSIKSQTLNPFPFQSEPNLEHSSKDQTDSRPSKRIKFNPTHETQD